MKRMLALIAAILMCLASCSDGGRSDIPDGAETIKGVYMCDTLPTGYFFNDDGYGVQYIGDEAYQIKYYISGQKITIENFSVEGGSVQTFDFVMSETHINIAGIEYKLIQTDESFQSDTISVDNAG